MIIDDAVYGTWNIHEPVLLELMQSSPMQRVKDISHIGVPDRFYRFPGFSRHEHCVGAMLITRKLGGTLESQVAALLHDVSHTAFSHVVDWILQQNHTLEEYQDDRHNDVIMNSEIPSILRKYGFNPEKIAHPENFSIVDNPAPDICADRLDYSLREIRLWIDRSLPEKCANDLVYNSIKGGTYFRNPDVAEKYARAFLRCQMEHWGGADTIIRWESFARILQRAIEKEIISFDDLHGTESPIMDKLCECNDHAIRNTLSALEKRVEFSHVDYNPDIVRRKKFRHVDPWVSVNGCYMKVSEINPDFKQYLESCREENQKGIRVKVHVPDLNWSNNK